MTYPSLSLLHTNPATWPLPPLGKTYVGVNDFGVLILKQHDGTISELTPAAPTFVSYANASGTTTIVAPSVNSTAVVTVTASVGRSVPLVLDTTSLIEGQQMVLRVNFPQVDGLVINIYATSPAGPLLSSFTSAAGSGITNGLWTFYVQSGVWVLLSNQIPSAS
jgi:hypothetical protein